MVSEPTCENWLACSTANEILYGCLKGLDIKLNTYNAERAEDVEQKKLVVIVVICVLSALVIIYASAVVTWYIRASR